MKPDLVWDLETVGPPWEEIDEPTREYLTRRAETRGGEAAPERTGLDFGLHRIAAVGFQRLDTGAVTSYVAMGLEDEPKLLSDTWGVLRKAGRLITFNGRGFDGPALTIRSAILGVPVMRDLVGYRFDFSGHLDLAEALSYYGATRANYGLDYWCRRFGVKGKTDHGANVGEMSEADLRSYVGGDVIATAALYTRLRDASYLAMFKGGPHAERRPDEGSYTGDTVPF